MFCPGQLFALTSAMSRFGAGQRSVSVSILNGALIRIDVWPNMKVREFKNDILRDKHWKTGLESIKEDIRAITMGMPSWASYKGGFRISTWDGQLKFDSIETDYIYIYVYTYIYTRI